jgi:hypothetical protein
MRTRGLISAAVAIGIGFLLLLSLLVPGLEELRTRVLNWAVLLAAVALVMGLVNLFQLHLANVRNRERTLYSALLLVGMLVTFGITLWEGSGAVLPSWIFANIQFPVETSLMAVLAVTLTLAAARLLQQRNDRMSIVFVVTLFILLLSSGPLFGLELPFLTRTVGPYITNFISVGALRGLLIGVALGTVATALRILIGADRPYSG